MYSSDYGLIEEILVIRMEWFFTHNGNVNKRHRLIWRSTAYL